MMNCQFCCKSEKYVKNIFIQFHLANLNPKISRSFKLSSSFIYQSDESEPLDYRHEVKIYRKKNQIPFFQISAKVK